MANNDFEKTRNDFQQYDLVTVFKASETRLMRHLHVATMAVVTKIDGDSVQCMPFPIREGTTTNNIYAYNIGKSEFKEGDKVLVIFTDRDFRKNYSSATTSERSIATTNDAKLHSIDYGVVIPIAKQYEGSIEALREKVDNHINNSNNPHKVTKEQVNLGDVVNQGMDTAPTKGSGKYVTSGGVYDSIESVKSDLNATNEVINQFESKYTTKDYVDGNFANKNDTNKAIEAVSTKATNNEVEISSIKENYVTKTSADGTYAKATDVNKRISELDTKISNTDGKVSTLEKSVTDINSSLATKQDKLSFGNGLSNANNVVTVDFTKVQSKFTTGSGLSFSEGTLSVDTAVIPTIEYLNAQSYGKASDVTKNAEAIAEIKKDYATSASIGNGKVVIKQNGAEKGSFTMNQGEATEINLTDTNTHVDVVNNLDSTSSTSALSAYQGNVLNGKISDTNNVVAGKQDAFTVGNGLTYSSGVLAVDTNKFVGYTDYTTKMGTIDTDISSLKTSTSDNKKSIDTINTNVSSLSKNVEDVTAKANANASSISSLDTRTTSAESSIASLTSAVNDRYTKGEIVDNSYAVYIPTISVGADPSAFPSQNKVSFNEIGNGSWIGGLGYPWWHIMTMQGEDTNYFTQIAVMMAYGDTPQLAFRNKAGEDSWAVAISNRTIGQQTVKDFTATEINHGCKFNGDLQSTTKASAPVVEVTDHLVNYNGDIIELPKSSGTLAIVHKESVTYDEIELAGSLYEWFGDEKNKVYNVFLKISGKPLIRMDFNEDKNDFLTADGKSCLDYPDMVGLLYETY